MSDTKLKRRPMSTKRGMIPGNADLIALTQHDRLLVAQYARMTYAESELYGVLCDVIERAWNHLPIWSEGGNQCACGCEFDCQKTSGYSRNAANRVMEYLMDRGLIKYTPERIGKHR
jgi:hypothetical protein